MNRATLHYIFDPFCGWCYAAAPLIEAASTIPELSISLHGGGMLSGSNRRLVSPSWRNHVIPHDRRIAALSGQIFGDAYFNQLLNDYTIVLDSSPPITAILCAQAMQGLGLEMLHKIQSAYYQHGQKIAEPFVLLALAGKLGLDQVHFGQLFEQASLSTTSQHIAESQALLAQSGGSGFPCFILAIPGHPWQQLDVSPYLGKVQAWRDFVQDQLAIVHRTNKTTLSGNLAS
ncbi:DsbA family protein [Methylobacillus gramineus]|uniref:DsbA family protein n=1 Tax=Methylobacillus gramineus TaxID=755169 RepID=UPI001CFF5FBB|nr:DsbA family protein [Methylobacillus gramineus]MCB5184053.1 DsbA family protein [Methylobacillus gramineus]